MWSGGKDSALVLHRATAEGMQIKRLINIHDAATRRVRFHGTRVDMIQAQADAAWIELRTIGSSWPDLEARLVAELAALRSEDFVGIVFGDIHLAHVRAWFEDRVKAAGLEHIEPSTCKGIRRCRWPSSHHLCGLEPTRLLVARPDRRRGLRGRDSLYPS